MNTVYYPNWKRFIKKIISLFVVLSCICFYLIGIFFLFVMCMFLEDNNEKLEENKTEVVWMKLAITIPALLNVVLICIFDDFFEHVSTKMTDFENHKKI